MTPSHLPTVADLARWPQFTSAAPLSVLVSACITGSRCGTDGSAYGAPYRYYAGLIADGATCRVLPGPIAVDCPVRLMHGQADVDVPWRLSLDVAAALRSADVQVTLVKDGDHRLSRPADLALLTATLDALPVAGSRLPEI